MPTIRRALISVTDKTGIVEFARALHARGVEILSTGGTAAHLRAVGIPVVEVADYTEFPEMLDGRVKTLHPKIHAGILAIRGCAEHMAALQRTGIAPIDCVVVNLYPFAATATRPGATFREVIEQIDIGGPSLLRAAAKNHADVVPLCDPGDYAAVLRELVADGAVGTETTVRLAQKVFLHTAAYDAVIARYVGRQLDTPPLPDRQVAAYEKIRDLRYGENPHQRAAWYRLTDEALTVGEPLQGKALSYNNLLDADAAIGCVREFAEPAVVIVKHTNPCGVGSAATLVEAFARALAGDPVAAYGGIVACNRPVDSATAAAIARTFFEVVCAPAFSPEALAVFATKKNVRLLPYDPSAVVAYDMRSACGGRLVQEADIRPEDPSAWTVVTKREPTSVERAALLFAWRVVKHVRSNAIVLTATAQTVGIGAGQMSRVDAVRLASRKMFEVRGAKFEVQHRTSNLEHRTIVAASDAFFPFRDGVDELARAGVTAVIQPGGSVRDTGVIAAADAQGIAMLCTGTRHFRH